MQLDPECRNVGVIQTVADFITPAPASGLAALLDRDARLNVGDELPPAWHWAYFWSPVRQSQLGNDGHARTGSFLPDLGLPRRMAAAGRMLFSGPLLIGDYATRKSCVLSVNQKEGRNGKLAFVKVEHEICVNGATRIVEEQDIVYREPAIHGSQMSSPSMASEEMHWSREVTPSEPMLFRYSALTFNSHRIHYDREYATGEEGYPDLIVHGPLIATLLLDLLARELPEANVVEYAYKAIRPTFLGKPFTIRGRLRHEEKQVDLWSADYDGWLTMFAQARLG